MGCWIGYQAAFILFFELAVCGSQSCPSNKASCLHAPRQSRAASKLAVTFSNALSEDAWTDLEQLIADAELRRSKRRDADSENITDVGQSTFYLHQKASKMLLDELWSLGRKADSQAGWNISAALPLRDHQRPHLRCLEQIDYDSRGSDAHPAAWHYDGNTLLSTSVMLSEPGSDFQGGEFEIRRTNLSGDGFHVQRITASKGDVVIFRGWDEHRVHRIGKGQRRIVVAEWWMGPAASNRVPRSSDNEEGFVKALAIDPQSTMVHHGLGMKLLERGKLKEAEHRVRFALKFNPTYGNSHFGLGTILERQGLSKAAVASFKTAVQINPGDADSHNSLGKSFHTQNNLEKAMSSFQSALSINPHDADIHNSIGSVHRANGNADGALKAFIMARKLAPEFAGIHYNLGLVYMGQQDFKNAVSCFQSARAIDNTNVNILLNLGFVLVKLGKIEKAISTFKNIIKLDPGNAAATKNIEVLRRQLGKAKKQL